MSARERDFRIEIVVTEENDGIVSLRRGPERSEERLSVADASAKYLGSRIAFGLEAAARATGEGHLVAAERVVHAARAVLVKGWDHDFPELAIAVAAFDRLPKAVS